MIKTMWLALFLLLALQQAPETGTFVYTQGGTEVLTEKYTRSAAALDGDIRVANGQRISYSGKIANGIVTEMTLRAYAPEDTAKPAQVAVFRFSGDSMTLETTRNGAAVNERRAVPRGSIPLINPSVAMMQDIVLKAKATNPAGGTVSVILLSAPQQVVDVPVTIKGTTEATVMLGETALAFKMDPRGRLMSGEVPSQGVTITRK
jgi:hypothetical protein